MKKIIFIMTMMVISFIGCGSNSNVKVELSEADSRLVNGTKVYAGYNFNIYEITIDDITYLVNSAGGIIKK